MCLPLAACGGGAATASDPSLAPGEISIAEVQGVGSVSPYDGQSVTVTGIVSGDFQDVDDDVASNLGGFYLQQGQGDGDAMTSDAIFVYDGSRMRADVSVGDRLRVFGKVKEHFGETQLNATAVEVIGSGMIEPLDISLPATDASSNSDGDLIADLERYEGMLLRLPQQLTISNMRNLERFGELTLAQGGRLYQFTNTNSADVAGYAAHKRRNALRSIVLDDGLRASNPRELRYLVADAPQPFPLRVGATLSGVTGNLRYSRGSGGDGDEGWRLMPTAEPIFRNSNPRPAVPQRKGELRVASFNVLNFFSTVDSGNNSCGPRANANCRGADSARELQRQLAKIVTALEMIDADIAGLVELENNSAAAIAMLLEALNKRVGANAYQFVDTGSIGDDAITTGFIYKTATVVPIGEFAILDSSEDARFDDSRNRPVLTQTFERTADAERLTVAINHLKSKGSDCNSSNDPNLGDGQGNCNRTRRNAAAALADWLAQDPTGSGDPDYLIVGDLNAYLMEEPLQALRDAGLVSLLDPSTNAYSFVFDAQSGALDHALASPTLAAQVERAFEWHINADEAAVHDYNLEHGRDPGLFDADSAHRASDHDPIIVDIDLGN